MAVVLPNAAPGEYVRWLEAWRAVEEGAAARAAGAHDDVLERAPRSRESVADFLAWELAGQVARQADVAGRAGRDSVSPRVRADGELLAETLGYLIRWIDWLREPGVPQALGIEPLDDELTRIWAGVIAAFRERMARERATRARRIHERHRSGQDQRLAATAGHR